MSNYTQIITNGLITLTGALINLVYKNYIAWWILLGLTLLIVILGIVIYKIGKKKDE